MLLQALGCIHNIYTSGVEHVLNITGVDTSIEHKKKKSSIFKNSNTTNTKSIVGVCAAIVFCHRHCSIITGLQATWCQSHLSSSLPPVFSGHGGTSSTDGFSSDPIEFHLSVSSSFFAYLLSFSSLY